MKLGEHPNVRPLLEKMLTDNARQFRNYAIRHGVEASDTGDVVQETYLTVYNLEPQNEVVELLNALGTLPPEEERRRIDEGLLSVLTALFGLYLKFTCKDYLRRRKRQQTYETPLEGMPGSAAERLFDYCRQGKRTPRVYPVVEAKVAPETQPTEQTPEEHEETKFLVFPVLTNRELSRLLLETGLRSQVDATQLEWGDFTAVHRLYELLAQRANLNEEERRFLFFRVTHPGARDQEFDKGLKAYQITRIKQRVFGKLIRFLGLTRA